MVQGKGYYVNFARVGKVLNCYEFASLSETQHADSSIEPNVTQTTQHYKGLLGLPHLGVLVLFFVSFVCVCVRACTCVKDFS